MSTLKAGDYVKYKEGGVCKVSRYNKEEDMIFIEASGREYQYGSSEDVIKINPAYLHKYKLNI